VRERLEREYDLELLATTPNVRYEVLLIGGMLKVAEGPERWKVRELAIFSGLGTLPRPLFWGLRLALTMVHLDWASSRLLQALVVLIDAAAFAGIAYGKFHGAVTATVPTGVRPLPSGATTQTSSDNARAISSTIFRPGAWMPSSLVQRIRI